MLGYVQQNILHDITNKDFTVQKKYKILAEHNKKHKTN